MEAVGSLAYSFRAAVRSLFAHFILLYDACLYYGIVLGRRAQHRPL